MARAKNQEEQTSTESAQKYLNTGSTLEGYERESTVASVSNVGVNNETSSIVSMRQSSTTSLKKNFENEF